MVANFISNLLKFKFKDSPFKLLIHTNQEHWRKYLLNTPLCFDNYSDIYTLLIWIASREIITAL